jgi:hypothetical protein
MANELALRILESAEQGREDELLSSAESYLGIVDEGLLSGLDAPGEEEGDWALRLWSRACREHREAFEAALPAVSVEHRKVLEDAIDLCKRVAE